MKGLLKLPWKRIFFAIWLIASVVISCVITITASSATTKNGQEIAMDNIAIPVFCSSPESCGTTTSPATFIQMPDIQKTLDNFAGFFPIAIVAKVDVSLGYAMDTNLFFEVTKPSFSDKLNYVAITCNGEAGPRYISGTPSKDFPGISLADAKSVMQTETNKLFNVCAKPSVDLKYIPSKKIEVAPNEYVKMVTNGDKPTVTFTPIVTEKLNLFSQALLFFIILTLCFGAGLTIGAFFSGLLEKGHRI